MPAGGQPKHSAANGGIRGPKGDEGRRRVARGDASNSNPTKCYLGNLETAKSLDMDTATYILRARPFGTFYRASAARHPPIREWPFFQTGGMKVNLLWKSSLALSSLLCLMFGFISPSIAWAQTALSPVSATASGTTVQLTSTLNGSATNYPLSASYTYTPCYDIDNSNLCFSSAAFTSVTSGAYLTGGTN